MVSAIPFFPDFSVSEHVARAPHRYGPLFRKWFIDHGRIVFFTTGKLKTGADKDAYQSNAETCDSHPWGLTMRAVTVSPCE